MTKYNLHAQGSLKLANCCTHQKLIFFALQSQTDVDDILHNDIQE